MFWKSKDWHYLLGWRLNLSIFLGLYSQTVEFKLHFLDLELHLMVLRSLKASENLWRLTLRSCMYIKLIFFNFFFKVGTQQYLSSGMWISGGKYRCLSQLTWKQIPYLLTVETLWKAQKAVWRAHPTRQTNYQVPQQEVPALKCIKLTKKTRNYAALIFLFSTTFGRLAPVEETSVELKEIRFSDIF